MRERSEERQENRRGAELKKRSWNVWGSLQGFLLSEGEKCIVMHEQNREIFATTQAKSKPPSPQGECQLRDANRGEDKADGLARTLNRPWWFMGCWSLIWSVSQIWGLSRSMFWICCCCVSPERWEAWFFNGSLEIHHYVKIVAGAAQTRGGQKRKVKIQQNDNMMNNKIKMEKRKN